MENQQSKFGFFLMSLEFKVRDILKPRINVLKEIGIKPGSHVLDFGCGPGGYIKPLANLVGSSGKIYALDMNPQALKTVKALAVKHGLKNVETIQSDGPTRLPDASLDTVLLFDVLHDIENRDALLAELRRILKGDGVLSVTDHHLTEEAITSHISGTGLFRLLKKGKIVYNFVATDKS
ncbi:MAG: class I SAM-dependent methyltransferase [Dehalococcoidales bacterium]|jgi:ubiquinone/menaquinone biosynthesis C-methylase UbiE